MKKVFGLLLGMTLALAGCSDGTDYANALPKNPAAVVAVDVRTIIGKSGINAGENAAVKERMKLLVKGTVNGMAELVDAIAEDASESGIDFGKDIYCFAGSGMATYGFVARTDDSGKLEDLLEVLHRQGICGETKETDGGRFVVAANWLLAYSDRAVVALADAKEADGSRLERRASMMLRQEEGEGFASTADFREMTGVKADLSLWLSMDVLPLELTRTLTMGAAGDMDLRDVKSIAHVNFEKGRTTVDFKTLIEDKYIGGLMERNMLATNDIDGKMAADFPANTPIWMNVNVNGKEMYSLIRQIPAARMRLEKSLLPLDFEEIFGAMKGECVLAVTDVRRGQFVLTSEVADKGFMKSFEELKPLMKLTNGQAALNSTGEDEYEFVTTNASLVGLGTGPAAYWFGVRDGLFYLTNDRDLVDRNVLGLSMADRPFGKEIGGKRFYMSLNMTSMKNERMEKDFLKLVDGRLLPLFENLDYMTVAVNGSGSHRMDFVMKNRDRNLMEMIVNLIKF